MLGRAFALVQEKREQAEVKQIKNAFCYHGLGLNIEVFEHFANE